MKIHKYKIRSAYVIAPTKAKALSKLKAFAKRIDCKVTKVRSWRGGTEPTIYHKGKSMGKNYWFDYDMKPAGKIFKMR